MQERKVLSVTELNSLTQKMLETQFANVWVEGEISNYKGVSSSGHCYFSLKDAGAQIDAVAFRGVMSSLRFELAEGLKVLLLGRVSLYPQRGRYQIIASALEPQGAGALQMAFEQLKKKLAEEGLFAQERKRAIPMLPQKIGIVTSPTGAAIRDMLTVLNRRFSNVEILIYPAKVQGEGAGQEVADGINYLNKNHADLDVLLVGRGGGSIEDLWAFNEEVVARAIYGSRIPIISCVGHEIDFTIADFVADLRAPTPSAAAEIVVQSKQDLLQKLNNCAALLKRHIDSKLNFFEERVKGLSRATPFTKPLSLIEAQEQYLDDCWSQVQLSWTQNQQLRSTALNLALSKLQLLSPKNRLLDQDRALKSNEQRLLQSLTRLLQNAQERLNAKEQAVLSASPVPKIKEHERFINLAQNRAQTSLQKKLAFLNDALLLRAGQLEALSPLAVLSRGYSILWSQNDQKIVKSSKQVKEGDSIKVRLHSGQILARVEGVNYE